ncbi:MAG TPA: D-glycero-beta-D-manno-heptose-7-phosphate kinase [Vicinamibacterales bacterium]|jgi:rfaE bifunctional protein kinase chain/domain|nr:D-glycero-beta-D-manno-heptose-7-phosphate kinase [Vicinamibacterales bacterium]
MSASDLASILARADGRSVLVVGDVMLDHFVIGHVDRISPEAPVPVVTFHSEEFRLGGAANVAHNVRAMGGRVRIVGLVGSDPDADRLRTALKAADISAHLIDDPGRRTTRKLRVVTTRNQQVARIDYEHDGPTARETEERLTAAVHEGLADADVVLISDYQKGAVTQGVARAAIDGARERGVLSLVDPKVPHIDYYTGASLVTPNHHEAEAVTLTRVRTSEDARAAAHRFKARARCGSVLITRGEHGMWLLAGDDECDLPAEAREVSDVTGAGDTVIAAMALAVAGGASLVEAARLANYAAGLAVSRFGPAAISAADLRAALASPQPAA